MRLEDQSTVDQSVLPEESLTLEAGVGEARAGASLEPQQLDRFRLERLLGHGDGSNFRKVDFISEK